MKTLKSPWAAAVMAATLQLCAVANAAEPGPGRAWWRHIEYLADDRLQGRLPGSPGYAKAAAYVEARFKAYGLAPLAGASFRRPIGLVEQRVLIDRSSVVLVADGQDQPLSLGQDLNLSPRLPLPAAIEAPLVFVGYGLHIPRAGYDDFAGQDLKGKILVVINGGPGAISAAMKSGARAAETWKAAERAGALGVVTLLTPKSMDIPWSRQASNASQPGMYLADPALQETRGPRFVAAINPAQAEKLFARSGHSYAEVLALADAARPITGFPLNLSLKARIATEIRTLRSPDLVGVLKGSDPRLSKQYVVISAHLDHLGVGAPINGDAIYNGAMDDASGVASVLEAARHLGGAKARPKRSLIFAVFTAEEKGLLGSRAFAERPGLPKGALVADLNMDMALPLWPLKSLYMPGADESSLGQDVRSVAAAQGYEIVPDPFPDRNVFTRTDQFSFVRAGVPAVALKFGFRPGTPEAQIEHDWRANRYHAPSDDLQQPVDLAAAAQFNRYLEALALRLANQPAAPQWEAGSVFAPASP